MRLGKNNGNGSFGSDNLPTKRSSPGPTTGGRLAGPPPGRPGFGGNGNGNGGANSIGGGAGRAAPTMRGIPKDDHDRMLDRCLGKPEH
jgi:hypothetical protein